MASSKSKSKAKSKPAAKAKASKPAKAVEAKVFGDHARLLPPKTAVVSFIKEIGTAKSRTSVIGQDVTEATKLAKERGVNVPAARIAERIYKKAMNDPVQGRTLFEDVTYYLIKCMDFDKIAPAGMFDPAETRSTKQSKKNGKKTKPEAEQSDIEEVLEDQPLAEAMSDAIAADSEQVVH